MRRDPTLLVLKEMKGRIPVKKKRGVSKEQELREKTMYEFVNLEKQHTGRLEPEERERQFLKSKSGVGRKLDFTQTTIY